MESSSIKCSTLERWTSLVVVQVKLLDTWISTLKKQQRLFTKINWQPIKFNVKDTGFMLPRQTIATVVVLFRNHLFCFLEADTSLLYMPLDVIVGAILRDSK